MGNKYLIGGMPKHTDLEEKQVNGIIDHADGSIPASKLLTAMGLVPVLMSFESAEQTVTKIYFPFTVIIMRIRGIVMKGLAITDDGTIIGANAAGPSTPGVITCTQGDPLNTEYVILPVTNNIVQGMSYYQLTSHKTTTGGKVLVILEYIQL